MALDITAPCPDKPNCVSSLADSADSHAIAPFKFEGFVEEAKIKLRNIFLSEFECKLTEIDDDNWHCVFTSSIMRYKDDVYLRFYGKAKKIDFRSASRKGYYDLGANRKRMEKIRKLFE